MHRVPDTPYYMPPKSHSPAPHILDSLLALNPVPLFFHTRPRQTCAVKQRFVPGPTTFHCPSERTILALRARPGVAWPWRERVGQLLRSEVDVNKEVEDEEVGAVCAQHYPSDSN